MRRWDAVQVLIDDQPARAEALARNLVEDTLPRRWSHVEGVAARARSLAVALAKDKNLLEGAAWLHDIGSEVRTVL
jgi:HD superfamily phosphodiesterase